MPLPPGWLCAPATSPRFMLPADGGPVHLVRRPHAVDRQQLHGALLLAVAALLQCSVVWCSRPGCTPGACLLWRQLRYMAAWKPANSPATASCTALLSQRLSSVGLLYALLVVMTSLQVVASWRTECFKLWALLLPLNTCCLPSLVPAGGHLPGPHGAPPVWLLARRLPPQAQVWRGAKSRMQTTKALCAMFSAPWSLQHSSLPCPMIQKP